MSKAPKESKSEDDTKRDEVLARMPDTSQKPHSKSVSEGGSRGKAESEMLTPEELEQLRQSGKEASAYARRAFAYLRTKASDE